MPINPFTDKSLHYQVHLEVNLKGDEFIFGFINISHIPYNKFEELFRDQIGDERFLFDDIPNYQINENLYLLNKEFLDKEIPFTFDFKIFEYNVGFCSTKKDEKYYHKELPPFFE